MYHNIFLFSTILHYYIVLAVDSCFLHHCPLARVDVNTVFVILSADNILYAELCNSP